MINESAFRDSSITRSSTLKTEEALELGSPILDHKTAACNLQSQENVHHNTFAEELDFKNGKLDQN